MQTKILTFLLLFIIPIALQAQFHTITKEIEIDYSIKKEDKYSSDIQEVIYQRADSIEDNITILGNDSITASDTPSSKKCNDYALSKNGFEYAKARGRIPRTKRENREKTVTAYTGNLPELTIPNLLEEIKRNGIKYPKIVLAQAILETGWFKSSVCRNKNNLFGLTNPRTKTYYEFDHWTESVKAYYTKVQYKYKGGNYLLWLRDIGYAEDKTYIIAIIRVLKTL